MNTPARTPKTQHTRPRSPQMARHVLIVDDSRAQRKVLALSLRRWGYRISEAESGCEALALCEKDPPDLVLSDWVMPNMNGLQFCRAFRAMARNTYGYFILLTSKSEKDEVAQGLDAGADDFLTKPFNAHELRARLTAGERILSMQAELTEKNRLIGDTLSELQTLYNALDSDLAEARKLQQSLIRERHRSFGRGAVSLMLHPAGHVGGDLVGFYPISANRIGLFAIDVSGHGVSSALMAARLAGYLSSTVPAHNIALAPNGDGSYSALPPARVVERLNEIVLEDMETEHYFTMILADADLATGQVRFVQAGHPHPLLQRADGSLRTLGAGGMPVGLIATAHYEETTCTLAPGDRLLLLSDGVSECTDQHGKMLGENGLHQWLAGHLHQQQGRRLLDMMLAKLRRFTAGNAFPDDVSGILLERYAMQGPAPPIAPP